jgi:uncharacterized protein (DUF2336 family)
MNPQDTQQLLDTLRELRDGQREMLALMTAQQARAEEQVQKSRDSVAESVALQRLALARQRTVGLIAVPAIGVCVAAIAYLIWRYF